MDADTLFRVAQQEFGIAHVTLRYVNLPFETDPDMRHYEVHVNERDDSWFRIEELVRGAVGTNGTEEQDARIAVAIRAALPEDFPRIVAVSDDAGMYVDLVSGITSAMIRAGWRDVSEGGF